MQEQCESTTLEVHRTSRGESCVPRFGSAIRLAMMSMVLSGDVADAQGPQQQKNQGVVSVDKQNALSSDATYELSAWKADQKLSHLRNAQQKEMVRELCCDAAQRKSLVDIVSMSACNTLASAEERQIALEVLNHIGLCVETNAELPILLTRYQTLLNEGDQVAWKLFPLLRAAAVTIGVDQEEIDRATKHPCDPVPRTIKRFVRALVGPQLEFFPIEPPALMNVLFIEKKHGIGDATKYLLGTTESELFTESEKMAHLCLLTHYGDEGFAALREARKSKDAFVRDSALHALCLCIQQGINTKASGEELTSIVQTTEVTPAEREKVFRTLAVRLKESPYLYSVLLEGLPHAECSNYIVNAFRDTLIAHADDPALVPSLLQVIRTAPHSFAGKEALRVLHLAGKSCPKAADDLQMMGMEAWNTLPSEKEFMDMDSKAKGEWTKQFDAHTTLALTIGRTMRNATDEQRRNGRIQLQNIVLSKDSSGKGVHPDQRVRYAAVQGLIDAGFNDTEFEEFLRRVAGTCFDSEVSTAVRGLAEIYGFSALERLVKEYPENGLVKYFTDPYIRR